MITTKEIKIRKSDIFTSEYVEKELSKTGEDILRWAITSCDDEYYTISAAVVCKR